MGAAEAGPGQCLGYLLVCDEESLGCLGGSFLSNPLTLLSQVRLIWGKARKWTDLGHLEVLGVPWLLEVPGGLGQ